MKKLTFLLLVVFLANGQQQKNPITIESIFNESSMVFSGLVVDKQSYWDVDRKMIYTVHKVKVSKSFKGNQNEFQYVVSKGGTVGLEGVVIKPSVTIEKKSYGYFMVKMATPLRLEGFNKSNFLTEMIYSGASYYDYDRITDIVNIPNQNHLSKQNFEKKLKLFSKKKEIVLDDFFQSIYLKQQAGVNDIEISSISPISIVAGNKEILTISGSGFGDFISGSNYGVVSFKNSDSGGSTWKTCLKTQIVSWTDTQIRVEVPSDSGSGSIRITTAADIDYESAQTIEIPYSINTLNYPQNGSDDEIFEYPIFHTGSSLEDILDSDSNPYDNISNGQYIFT
ncbi:MAG: IPT/TIG domain-containing protein, partial [Bacteroidota bacterium]|nr:IPT/TIG domain-containing protein [Bacteroidota bacterium]